ncbi:MAG: flagellar basal body L-ring protein FlgH [Gemmatimonadaceae bacterium]
MKTRMKLVVSLACLAFGAPLLLAQTKDVPAPARKISSWTSDRHEFQVGDVITVLVTEATLASATKSQNGTDQQTRKNDLGINPPQMGTTPMPNIDMTVSTGKNASSTQTGDAKRNVSFKGDISVRVVAVDKAGLLQIKGAKAVDVDKNKQTLNLTGWVRPEDISPQNYVASERVADAQLTYALTGDIGKTRGGLIGRLVSVFWP